MNVYAGKILYIHTLKRVCLVSSLTLTSLGRQRQQGTGCGCSWVDPFLIPTLTKKPKALALDSVRKSLMPKSPRVQGCTFGDFEYHQLL